MKQRLTLIFILSVSLFGSAQKNTGFYGKTAFVELNTALSFPLFNRFDDYSTNRFNDPDKLATALNIVVGKSLGRKVALSLESGIFYGNFSAESDYSYDDYYYDESYYTNNKYKFSSFEKLSYRTFTIMPKLEFSGTGGTSPGGLTHQVGIGFTSSRITDKDYEYRLRSGYTIDPATEIANYDAKYKGYTIMYAINLRVPISKTLLFNYGLRTTLNITKADYRDSHNKNLFIVDDEAHEAIRQTRLRTLLNLQFGLTYLIF